MNYERKPLSAGDEVISICTRCKEGTIHRVVAMVESKVHLVLCTRCEGRHRYRPPSDVKKERVVRSGKRRVKADKTIPISQPNEEWQNLKESTVGLKSFPYDQDASYQVGHAIEHPTFGLGFVRKVIGDTKMEVVFEQATKRLIMNRTSSSQTLGYQVRHFVPISQSNSGGNHGD